MSLGTPVRWRTRKPIVRVGAGDAKNWRMESVHPIRRGVPEEKEVAVGEEIEEAYSRPQVEAQHHTKLAQARDDAFENSFAQGFSEATRIVGEIRSRHLMSVRTSPPEGNPVEGVE